MSPFPAPGALQPGRGSSRGVEGDVCLAAMGLGPKLAFESPVSALGHPNPLGRTSGLAPKCRIGLSSFGTGFSHSGCMGNAG